MRPDFTVAAKLTLGDRVAVVSLSFAAPGMFPTVHEVAMQRLQQDFGLEPVEYPTTRRLNSSPPDRAADLMSAFANPKPLLGYSDNTNLLNWLWNIGVVSYDGGSTMVHLGRGGGVHPVTAASLRAALFIQGDLDLHPVEEFSEDEFDWADATSLGKPAPTVAAPGWSWHQADRVVTAPTWGGNLEILHWNLAANQWIRPVEDYAGCVLLQETSEEMPSATEVFRMLRNAGERGLLEQFPAVLVGTAKASSLHRRTTPGEREQYRANQRQAVVRALDRYNPSAMVVFNIDLGHTDPQWILPYGGTVTVDGPERRITAHFS